MAAAALAPSAVKAQGRPPLTRIAFGSCADQAKPQPIWDAVLAYKPDGFFTAYEWIRHMMATQKADYFTAHDPDAFKAMKKPPEFYD